MKRVVFHTDLDNTLIYSSRYERKDHDLGKDLRCVEQYHEQEASFITQKTYQLLRKVQEYAWIIPTTTRTKEQYQRIDLGIELPYALVCNGGVLLREGREDEIWYQDSLELIKSSRSELSKALTFLEQERRRTFELRFIKELFVFTKCKESESVVENLKRIVEGTLVDVFYNGNKVYVVPKALSKGKAVERFRKIISAECVIAAGDSAFDKTMLEAADYGIATPQLAKQYSFAEHVKCPPSDMLYAEAVLHTVLGLCDGRQ